MARNIVDRILDKVVEDANGCWLFMGAIDFRSYGLIVCRRFKGRVVVERTHRIMYMAFNGDIAEGLVVRHRCDNTRCCNPKHLHLGTQKDNVHDQLRQGRHTSQQRRAVVDAPF
jgi:hypothetical protein